MVYISINLILNDKNEIKRLLSVIQNYSLSIPIYIVELESSFSVQFESDYEQYELINEFANAFKDHEFIEDLESGMEEVLMSIKTIQSPASSDGWGRQWNEDTIERSRYLVRKRKRPETKHPALKFFVLFGDELREYEVCIYTRTEKETGTISYSVAKAYVEEGQNLK